MFLLNITVVMPGFKLQETALLTIISLRFRGYKSSLPNHKIGTKANYSAAALTARSTSSKNCCDWQLWSTGPCLMIVSVSCMTPRSAVREIPPGWWWDCCIWNTFTSCPMSIWSLAGWKIHTGSTFAARVTFRPIGRLIRALWPSIVRALGRKDVNGCCNRRFDLDVWAAVPPVNALILIRYSSLWVLSAHY